MCWMPRTHVCSSWSRDAAQRPSEPLPRRWSSTVAIPPRSRRLPWIGAHPMWRGATEYFPGARIVFDKFHVMVLAGEALDQVRRELQREGADLKGAMWSLRGNTWNLSEDRQEQRKNLCRQYTKLGRAMSLRETLQAIYANSERQVAEAELHWWCGWAARSRLSPFRDLAKTIRQHWEGILAYFDTRLTSAAIEAVNGVIKLAKRMARGFRNFVYFRTAAYHRAGKLNLIISTMT